MYPVAHVVVACGTAWTFERVVRRFYRPVEVARTAETPQQKDGPLFDYRFVALGALPPDLALFGEI